MKMDLYSVFDLQLFAAEANVQTTVTTGVGNDLSPEMKTFYDRALLHDTQPNLVYGQFGQKKSIPKNGGKKIEWRKFSKLPKALTPLVEGVTPDGNKLNVTAIEGEVHQYGDYVTISDVLELTAIDNVILETTRLIGNQAGLTLDTIDREALMAGTNVMYADKVSGGVATEVASRKALTVECLLTVDMVMRAKRQLARQNAGKIDGSYVAVIHPDVAYDLKRDPEWQEWTKYTTSDKLFRGEIGMIDGVRFVETSEGKIWKDDTCPDGLAVYGTIVLGADAYGTLDIEGGGLEHIVKPKGSAGSADPLNQRSTIGWKAHDGTKILSDEYMVRVEHCSKNSAKAEAN